MEIDEQDYEVLTNLLRTTSEQRRSYSATGSPINDIGHMNYTLRIRKLAKYFEQERAMVLIDE